ncbi:MAG TPA: hypothetical protein VNO18_22590 [Xanthobacteraceae bacterium]|jgi:hypothetical protein|nr:hypothetical protein [Xanthobacteraceae bacterium]
MWCANDLLGILLGIVLIFGSTYSGVAGVICPRPAPQLSNQHSNNGIFVDAETVTFFYKSQPYPVDIYSAYAPQSSAPDSNYCIRYEAINRSQNTIDKFYWPLSGIQMDFFYSAGNVSIVTTKPPGRAPSLDETWIYSFLNEIARTIAYQKRADIRQRLGGERLVRSELWGPHFSFYSNHLSFESNRPPVQLAALEPIEQRFPLKEPMKFPEVGADFSNNDGSLTAISRATWDGSSSQIEILLDRGSGKAFVIAPVIYALSKARNAFEVLELVKAFDGKGLPFAENTDVFRVTSRFFPKDFVNTPWLYVIEQPVTLVISNRRVCFSTPVYSPMPIPEEFLRCKLF